MSASHAVQSWSLMVGRLARLPPKRTPLAAQPQPQPLAAQPQPQPQLPTLARHLGQERVAATAWLASGVLSLLARGEPPHWMFMASESF